MLSLEAEQAVETFNLMQLGASMPIGEMDALLSYRVQYLKIESDKFEEQRSKK